jgi:hypothetical protein
MPFNSVGGYSTGITATAVIDVLGNITGVGATFSGLIRANAGISAAGGVTFAGTLQGTTANFTGLVSSTVGFSGSGTNLTNIVKTINGLSGGVGFTNGSGIGLSVSGNTLTVSNTGVLSFNGLTGAVSGLTTGSLGGTYGSIQYKSAEGLCGSPYFTITDDPSIIFKNTLLTFIGPTGEDGIAVNAQQGLQISRVADYLGLDEGGGPGIYSVGYDPNNSGIANLYIGAVDGSDDDLNSSINFGFIHPTTKSWTTYAHLDRNPTGDPYLTIDNGCVLQASVAGIDQLFASVIGGGTFTALTRFTSGISASGGVTFSGTVASNLGYIVTSSTINAQTGTTYTFLSSDNGKIVTFNNASPITVTVPTGLPDGFNATGIQIGAGQLGFTAASGVTLNSYLSQYKILGQHGAATLISYTTNIYNLSGNLTV